MNINDLKVGDKVKIINAFCGDRSCNGKIGVITEEIANAGQFNLNRGINIKINDKEIWRVGFIACLELLPSYPSIHITTDGIETYAVLKEDGKVIKKSVAKCCKDDKFDFETGVKFAIDRLFEKKKEDKNNFSVVFGDDSPTWITIGKVYDFKDGRTVWDNSVKSIKYNNFGDFKRCNSSLQPFEIKKVKRQAKVGEYIQVVGCIKATNEEGKTTQSGDICVIISDKTTCSYCGYKWFKNINNDMVITLTNMYNDTPEYVVLEGYEKYIEYIEEKKKAEFKPHLISNFSGSFYGNIGKESSQVDVLGNRLNIGDTVDLYYGTEPRYETPVVKDDNVKTDFIMGLSGLIFTNGKAGDWTIVKNRSYEDVQDGEYVGFIKYIKNDPSKAIISTYKY